MNKNFVDAIGRAATLTRAGNLAEATRQIQAALRGAGLADPSAPGGPGDVSTLEAPRILDLTATEVRGGPRGAGFAHRVGGGPAGAAPSKAGRARRGLSETIRDLAAGRRLFEGLPVGGRAVGASPTVPPGAQFLAREFACEAGTLPYRIYVPASAGEGIEGLVLMLHGCTQDPNDFAVGTRMNEMAEAERLIVVYPQQLAAANPSRCWNWFDPAHQRRGAGEPAVLAAMARSLADEHRVPPERIFVAGLSAGGALAAILAETYPDVFAAAGIHSGLAAGSASDVVSAFAAMKGGPAQQRSRPAATGAARSRLIVFHGDADPTVHPSNAETIVAARRAHGLDEERHAGRSPRGRPFTRVVYRDRDGVAELEHWTLEGQGHAWSGGHAAGSYTDPAGPDASAEMIRFFLDGGRPERRPAGEDGDRPAARSGSRRPGDDCGARGTTLS